MDVISIKSQNRVIAGKKEAKRVRRNGEIPCVLYGEGENLHFSVRPNEVKHLIYTPDFKLAEIEVDGTTHKCFIKDIQFHPVTDEVQHIDFFRLTKGKKVKIEIPIHFHGVSPGVKSGGTLTQKLRKLKVILLPENIITEISMDISEVELGDTIRVKDVPEMNGITVLTNPSIPIASVNVPRALRSAQAEEEGEGEGDVEGEEGEEGGDGGESTSAEGGEN